MKTLLRFAVLLVAWVPLGLAEVWAQTSSLELNSAAGPAGNGITPNSQTVTFRVNSDNPSGNTFATYTPTTTATFTFSNQVYTTLPTGRISTQQGANFGATGTPANGGIGAVADPLFPQLSYVGASSNGNYTSLSTVAGGTGIDIASNYGVNMFFTAQALAYNATSDGKFPYTDLTITFNRPVVNPVLHFTGMGGSFTTGGVKQGFSSEYDLLTSGVTLSRLSGSTELVVSSTQIRNGATDMDGATGAGAASGSVLVSTPAAGISSLVFRVSLRGDGGGTWHPQPGASNDNLHIGERVMISVSTLAGPSITGYVYEDVNYGGGAGRTLAASNGVIRPGARVELYSAAGAFVAATTTDAGGSYSFSGLTASTGYTVRVVNSTVTSSRTGAISSLIPVQTYNGTASKVGGEFPSRTDAASNTTNATLASLTAGSQAAQSIATVTTGATGSAVAGPNFGYNFDLVVNTNDAGQGSLRQFILNSNALGGEASLAQSGSNLAGTLPAGDETSIFMIPNGTARPGLLASTGGGPASQLTAQNGQQVAAIAVSSVLPTITGPNTSIDGSTQTFNIGNTNNTTLGTGGTVGTAGTALSQLNGPEVQLTGARTYNGLNVNATDVTIRGLALYTFSNNINVANNITGTLIEQNVVGASATSFTDPGTGVRTVNQGIFLGGSDNGIIRNNLIGFNGGMGIWVNGGANNNQITNNEVRRNAIETFNNGEGYVFDGIELQGASTGNTVSSNLITESSGHGIDSFGNNGTGGNTITGNTISNNGVGIPASQQQVGSNAGEGSGLRVYGSTNLTTISNNIITGNAGSGVLVENVANLITISQNSIYNNTKIGIDLLNSSDLASNGNVTTSNVTINDNGDADTGGNGLLNFPVITSANVVGTNLVVTGYARPGSIIEFFSPGTADASGFGEGQTYLGTFTEGSGLDSNAGTGTYTSPINGLDQGTDNTNQFTFTIPLTGNFSGFTGGSLLTSTANLGGSTSEFSGNITATSTLSGYVFEDVNYGGGAGRPRSATGASVRPNARVELYDASGNFVSATTTDAAGLYTFNVVPASYTVRVVNSTVTSSRTGYVAGLLPVQTFNGTTTKVGGEAPNKVDAASGASGTTLASLNTSTTIAESQATVTVGATATTGPDFGYNFDVVVNTNNAGQGSLRQFILNSNALGGEATLAQSGSNSAGTLPAGKETSIFMIPTAQLTSGVAVISPTTALPTITGPNTFIDGSTQTFNIGNTNNTTLGTGSTVGTAGTALSQLNGPEVQLTGSPATSTSGNFGTGLDVGSGAAGGGVVGLSIYGFGLNGDNDNSGQIRIATGNYTITRNVIGTTAASFTDAGAGVRGVADGIRFTGGTVATTITNNLIGFNGGKGISTNNGVTNITISNNEVRGNAIGNSSWDGIDVQGSATTVSNNLVINNAGVGIDGYNTAGSNTFSGNTVSGNGRGTAANAPNETPGIRIYGPSNTISQNIITGNYGAGVMVTAGASTTTITRNSIFNNGTVAALNGNAASGQIGIDLSTNNEAAGTAPYVTVNDLNDADTGANGLLNFPIISSATVIGTNLVVTGYARPGSIIEFFNPGATADASGFGEGQTFLGTFTEGSAADTDNGTGTYSGTINGLNQGTDNTNRFTFTIPLTGNFASYGVGSLLTSTATLSNATSEFSGNVTVFQRPVANNDLATTTVGTPVTINVTGNDLNNIDAASINLNPDGLAGQSATTYTVAGVGTFTTVGAAAGSVIFTPANSTYTGTVTIPYVVSNTSGVLSNQANISVNITPAFDLATLITAPTATSVTAGSSLTYTVTSTNNSTFAANNVTQTLQLPAGLTSNGGTVTFTVNGTASTTPTYNNTTGLVTLTPTAVTLAAGATNTYGVVVSRVPAGGPITATANISSTGNGQETNAGNNVAVNTVTVNPSFDVTTTIVGPVNGSNAAVSVTRGNIVTYEVNTINSASSPSLAANVGQTVVFNTALTDVYASNGGTVVVSGGTTTVTFPALATLAVGQSVMNTISFVAPNVASYTATASVSATGDTNTGNNTAAVGTNTQAASGTATDVYTTISSNQTTAVAAGTAVTLTVVAGNNGPATANNVVTQVQLPTGLAGVTVANGAYNGTTGLVTFNTLTTLNSGAVNPSAFTIQFNAPTTGPVLATAVISTNNQDLVAGNNVAETKVDVATPVDVTTAVAGPATATVGQSVSFTATTANNGPGTAYNVVQTVQLPAGLSNVTFSNSAISSYDATTGIATFTLASPLAAGARQLNTVTFTVPASTITDPSGATAGSNRLSAVAAVRTSDTESSYTNNSAVATTLVTPATDVRVAVSGPSTTLVGSPATYTMSTTNNGPTTAASVVPTLQLPLGLTGVTVTDGTYDATTGLVTFTTLTNLRVGGSATNTVTVIMPDVTQLTPVAQAVVGSTVVDTDLSNNRASVVTLPGTATGTTADLSTNISLTTGSATPAPGTAIRLTATFTNTNAAGGTAASNVVPRVQLPAGLGTVTVSNGGSYDNTTGLVTWATTSLNAAATLSYTLDFTAPTNGTVRAVSFVSSATSDANATNNVSNTVLTVTPQTDVTTTISGPTSAVAGGRVTYAVRTLNNGPSVSTNAITQTVTVPAGVTNLTYPAGSTINGNTITFPVIVAEAAGAAGAVVNYVSFDAPTTAFTVNAAVSMTNDTDLGNNTASAPTIINRAPVALNVVNVLQPQNYQGSTAGPLRISPLVATDADAGQTLTYTLTSLPDPATGILYLDAAGTTPAATGVAYSATQANNLYFDPIGTRTVGATPGAAYIGNVFFTYTATDNATTPALSNPALYTIQIGRDNNSAYTVNPAKGGTGNAYVNNDIIATVLDANGAKYNATPVLTTNGVASATTADAASATTLSNLGLSLSTTPGTVGQIVVTNNRLLTPGTYTVNLTTVDTNGGTNTQAVTFTIGNSPLPVQLVSFGVKATGQDALLNWRTAAELNNDHFVVERSFDGRSFSAIGQVKGRGTSTTATDYTLTDARVAALAQGRVVYYRLQQVDTDGTATYSPVQTVRFDAVTPLVSLYPNPATTATTLDLTSLPTGSYQVTVLDATGRLIRQISYEAGTSSSLSVEQLPTGTYLLKVQGNGFSQNLRLVKE